MAVNQPIQTLFAVPMECDACVKDVSDSIFALGGITKVDASLKDQTVAVEGTAAPSAIVAAIQASGRDAILRGSGKSDSAAVCILETFEITSTAAITVPVTDRQREVRGLARMIQASPTFLVIDITLNGVTPGTYRASIREYGNLANGAKSTGPVWGAKEATEGKEGKGFLGTLEVNKDGKGAVYMDREFQVWELIGRAMVLTQRGEGEGLVNDENTVVGVIARSAGMWDNDKMVCSCTGKTLWEERKDEVKKGMV